MFIPEEAGPRQGGFCGGSGWVRACVTGVCCFPVAAMSVASGWPGQGPGGSPAASGGAGGVLEAASREPDDGAGGKREPGACAGIRLCVLFRPVVRVSRAAVPLAAFIPSRVSGRGRGRMGRVRVRGSGQAGSIKTTPAPQWGRRGRKPGDLAPGRWPGKLFMLFMPHASAASPAARPRGSWPGSGAGRRAGRSRPG